MFWMLKIQRGFYFPLFLLFFGRLSFLEVRLIFAFESISSKEHLSSFIDGIAHRTSPRSSKTPLVPPSYRGALIIGEHPISTDADTARFRSRVEIFGEKQEFPAIVHALLNQFSDFIGAPPE